MSEKIYLGTYTRRESQGIYSINLDTQAAKLTDLRLEVNEISPTYLAKSKKGNLYSVTTIGEQGGVAAYDHDLHALNAQTKAGASPCYVAVDEPRQLVYSANYHLGEISVYKIADDGKLSLTDTVQHTEPTGPHKNQDKPHVHYADLTPDQRVVACDLGTDRIYTYDIDDKYQLQLVNTLTLATGSGPRHLVFHPNRTVAYVFGELDSTITVLNYTQETGSFTVQQVISTIPDDFVGENGGAAIRISRDGRFLYASNRGHNSIVVYEITPDGELLTVKQHISTAGDFPRDFSLNETEEFLVCANQNTDNLTLFARDDYTGKLTLQQQHVFAPECVCVLFN